MARLPSHEVPGIVHEYDIHVSSRTIFLRRSDYVQDDSDPGVDHVFATKFLKNLHLLNTLSADPITIIMSTPGGIETEGMAIYDAIRESRCHVTIVVRGEASSMGSYILQAADRRLMGIHSTLMVHHGSSNGNGVDHKKSARNWIKFEERYGKRIDKILQDKIVAKHPEYRGKKFDELLNFDSIFFAEEAVELGLADEVVSTYEK